MKNYYSVVEFAKLAGIEASKLRYWDKAGIFKPSKRDLDSNYRYYSLAQITTVNFIATLSGLGIPLKTIAVIREKRNPEEFLRLLEKKERELDLELEKLRECSSIIHTKQEMIRYGLRIDETKISIMFRDEEWSAILWPRNKYRGADTFVEVLAAFVSHAKKHRINLSYPVGGRYDDMEAFMKAPERPDHFFTIDPTGTNVRKKGEYMVGFTRGYYGKLGDLPERMAQYVNENNLQLTGPVYITYPHDESCCLEPDQYLAQVMVAVANR